MEERSKKKRTGAWDGWYTCVLFELCKRKPKASSTIVRVAYPYTTHTHSIRIRAYRHSHNYSSISMFIIIVIVVIAAGGNVESTALSHRVLLVHVNVVSCCHLPFYHLFIFHCCFHHLFTFSLVCACFCFCYFIHCVLLYHFCNMKLSYMLAKVLYFSYLPKNQEKEKRTNSRCSFV